MERPIIGDQQTIIHIIHPIIIQGWQLMTAPAEHEADMMGCIKTAVVSCWSVEDV